MLTLNVDKLNSLTSLSTTNIPMVYRKLKLRPFDFLVFHMMYDNDDDDDSTNPSYILPALRSGTHFQRLIAKYK